MFRTVALLSAASFLVAGCAHTQLFEPKELAQYPNDCNVIPVHNDPGQPDTFHFMVVNKTPVVSPRGSGVRVTATSVPDGRSVTHDRDFSISLTADVPPGWGYETASVVLGTPSPLSNEGFLPWASCAVTGTMPQLPPYAPGVDIYP